MTWHRYHTCFLTILVTLLHVCYSGAAAGHENILGSSWEPSTHPGGEDIFVQNSHPKLQNWRGGVKSSKIWARTEGEPDRCPLTRLFFMLTSKFRGEILKFFLCDSPDPEPTCTEAALSTELCLLLFKGESCSFTSALLMIFNSWGPDDISNGNSFLCGSSDSANDADGCEKRTASEWSRDTASCCHRSLQHQLWLSCS